jgi:mRNA interferase HigB
MRIIAKKTIREFWEAYPDSEQSLKSWYQEVSRVKWKNPHQVKQHFSTASIIGDKRVVFNICGNKYRLIVEIDYTKSWVFVRFIGTHKTYNKVDATSI